MYFDGIGTTTMASMKLNAKSIGIEIDPEYYQICKERLEKKLFENPDIKREKINRHGRSKKEIQMTISKFIEENPNLMNLSNTEKGYF